MVSVHSSPNDQMLWALDSRWNVHVRVGITEEMPVGTDWEHVPGRDGWARRAAPHGQAGRCGRGLLVCRAPQPVPRHSRGCVLRLCWFLLLCWGR